MKTDRIADALETIAKYAAWRYSVERSSFTHVGGVTTIRTEDGDEFKIEVGTGPVDAR